MARTPRKSEDDLRAEVIDVFRRMDDRRYVVATDAPAPAAVAGPAWRRRAFP